MKHFIVFLSVLFIASASFLSVAQAQQLPGQASLVQDVPHAISYQGLLGDSLGHPVADGQYTVIMRLYGDAQGTQKAWQDTFTVAVQNGVFNVFLGNGAVPLPDANVMSTPLWLSMQVAGQNEMKPLTQLSSSPYALGIANNSVTTAKIQDNAITAEKIGTNYVGGKPCTKKSASCTSQKN